MSWSYSKDPSSSQLMDGTKPFWDIFVVGHQRRTGTGDWGIIFLVRVLEVGYQQCVQRFLQMDDGNGGNAVCIQTCQSTGVGYQPCVQGFLQMDDGNAECTLTHSLSEKLGLVINLQMDDGNEGNAVCTLTLTHSLSE